MAARIVSIGTAVPNTIIEQGDVRDLFAAQPGFDRRAARLVHAAFDAAAIQRRYTVLEELGTPATDARTRSTDAHVSGIPGAGFLGADGILRSPSTANRNAAYIEFAPELSATAAGAAIAQAQHADPQLDAASITHIITASCTGFFAPGPDFRLVRDLGLAPTTARIHIGYMGCAAALPALRAAADICAAHPSAVVLVACTELCSLHIRSDPDPQQIVAASVFADGAASAIVTARSSEAPGLDLDSFGTSLTTEGEADMVWTIGDDGFKMTLSSEVPRIIGREILGVVPEPEAIDAWAVHPGGRSILDRVEAGLSLGPSALDHSRKILREFGNMSSATVLFVLRDLLHDAELGAGAKIAALAFGPGLTVESAMLTKRLAVSR